VTSAIVMLALTAAWQAQVVPAASPAPSDQRDPQLEVTLRADKSVYRATETVLLRVCVKNISDKAVTIPVTLEFHTDVRPFFVDRTPTRTLPGPPGLRPPFVSRDEFLNLLPTHLLCADWPGDLRFWNIDKPGRYLWRALYGLQFPIDAKERFGLTVWGGGSIRSNPVEIEVVLP
jgi:hypothetical protein